MNILDSDCDALVNTVNCVGVMGAGLALQFKNRYPKMFEQYLVACQRGEVQIGKIWGYTTYNGKVIFNFPTKQHWRNQSRLEWIARGLSDLCYSMHEYGVNSIAIPPLGCGHGGLSWGDVEPLVHQYLLPETNYLRVEIYPPNGVKYQLGE